MARKTRDVVRLCTLCPNCGAPIDDLPDPDALAIARIVEEQGLELGRLRAAARLALDLLTDLSVAFHQAGSIRAHADPNDRTGWNVHGIETCDDPYCTEGLAAIDALRAALGDEP